MKWVIAILTAFFRALLPWVAKQRPTAGDAHPDRQMRDKLRDRIRKHWFALLLVPLVFVGCTRTIYVPHGTPVRLRETVHDVRVWVKDSDGEPVTGRMDLPEGWYALPMPEDDE